MSRWREEEKESRRGLLVVPFPRTIQDPGYSSAIAHDPPYHQPTLSSFQSPHPQLLHRAQTRSTTSSSHTSLEPAPFPPHALQKTRTSTRSSRKSQDGQTAERLGILPRCVPLSPPSSSGSPRAVLDPKTRLYFSLGLMAFAAIGLYMGDKLVPESEEEKVARGEKV